MYNNERNATTYDLKDHVVHFDGSRWYHKNEKWTGDRTVIVLYNNDFSCHDRWKGLHGPDTQTEEARAQPLLTEPLSIPIDSESSQCIELRRAIMEEVADVEWYHNEQEKYDGKAQMMLFGHTTRPYKRKARIEASANTKYPKLHQLLKAYMNYLVPRDDGKCTADMFSSILLAKNSQCNWHVDKQNVSSSYITCVGDYQGGGLRVNHAEPQPLYECMACHMAYKCLRVCRRQLKHAGPDYLPLVWGYMKAGLLKQDSELTTRRAIKQAGIDWL